MIRAWTEAEIGGSEFGRLGTDVLAEFTRVLTGRIRRSSPPDIDPQIAALAVVAMIERFNYYVLSRQVDVSRDEMLDTLARSPTPACSARSASPTDRSATAPATPPVGSSHSLRSPISATGPS